MTEISNYMAKKDKKTKPFDDAQDKRAAPPSVSEGSDSGRGPAEGGKDIKNQELYASGVPSKTPSKIEGSPSTGSGPSAREPVQEKADTVIQEHEKELEEELSSIYGEDRPEEVDMTKLEKSNRSLTRTVLVATVVFFALLTAVSWAGFFFFSPPGGKFSGKGVSLVIDGPTEVKGGELVTYAIRYRNGEDVPLGTAALEVRLPKDFVLHETDPSAEKASWQLGSIGADTKGEVYISGVFMAPLEKELDIQAILTYRPADFNSEFQKVETVAVTITDSVFEISAKGPPKVLPGDNVSLKFTYRNTSENAFNDMVFRTIYPEWFIPESSEPESEEGKNAAWTIPGIDAGEEGTVTIAGSFASEAKGRITITTEIGFMNADEEFQLQKSEEYSTDVLEGDLVTTLILNGKSDQQSVNFGETLRYTISYRNTGSISLGDVSVSLVFETEPPDGRMIKWNELDDSAGGVRDGNTMIWTSKQIEGLERIGADDDGIINVELPILDSPLSDITEVEYAISAWVETVIGIMDGEDTERTTKTSPVIAKVNSDTRLQTKAQYFNDDGLPVGSGPLPPEAGEKTKYRMTWKMSNSFHELSDLRISAKLPPNVTWTGFSVVDAGDLRFDAAAEKMIWELNWLPISIQELSVSFDVEITPAEEQRGKTPTLVDATILETIDKVTGASILLSAPPMTTSLQDDPFAAGKSRVQ